MGLPRWCSDKESACQCKRCNFDPWVGKIPWSREWQPAPVFLPWKLSGQRSLTGYSTWGCKELDTTEWLSTHIARILAVTETGSWKAAASVLLSHLLALIKPPSMLWTLCGEAYVAGNQLGWPLGRNGGPHVNNQGGTKFSKTSVGWVWKQIHSQSSLKITIVPAETLTNL